MVNQLGMAAKPGMSNKYGIDSKVFDYLMNMRKPEIEPPISNDNQMIAQMSNAAAQIGTLNGKQADTSMVQNAANTYDARAEKQRQEKYKNDIMTDQRGLKAASVIDNYNAAKRAREQKMNLERSKLTDPLNKTNQYIDKQYVNDTYLDFISKGKEGAAQSINMLEDYAKILDEESKKFFGSGGGAISSNLPDFMRSDKAIKMRDDITGIAMQGLKDMFGGAISDGERKALAATFYNDRLGPEQNLKILKRKLSTMKDMYRNQVNMADYFQTKGTLQGYSGISPRDELNELAKKDPSRTINEPKAAAAPKATEVAKEDQFKIGETKEAQGTTWRYIGNDQWEEVE